MSESTDRPAPTESVLAEALLEVRDNLRVLRSWMQETDRRLDKIDMIAEDLGAVKEHIRQLNVQGNSVATTLRGVAELSKSTYDMIAALSALSKEKTGGEDGGEVPRVKIQ